MNLCHSLRYCFVFFLFAFLLACEKEPLLHSGMGKKPIYIPHNELNDIANLPQQEVISTGTIFLREPHFFMLEDRRGIHVYDVSDPNFPTYLTFLKIPAITDFSISGNRLYADSWRDLLTLDITDLFDIKVISRNENQLNPILFPELYNGIFECVDESRGAIGGWEDVYLEEAACQTNN
nr:hypothetical protein [Saprospiraceae bacterium]